MSLTFPAAYSNRLKQGTTVTDWLLEIECSSGSDTVYLSGVPHDLTEHYYGVVKSWGTLTESVDLAKSRARVGDVSVTLLDKWADSTGRFSAVLLNRDGSKHYLNQAVTIKGWVAGITSISDCPTLYRGRLKEVKLGRGTVTLQIEARQPWDRALIPTTQIEQTWQPVVYGDFAPNASLPGSADECDGKALWPAPTLRVYGAYLWAALHAAGASTTTVRGHFWDKNHDKFIPIQDDAGTGYEDSPGTYRNGTAPVLYVDEFLRRVFLSDSVSEGTANDAYNFEYITASGSYAKTDYTVTAAANTLTQYFDVEFNRPDGYIDTDLTVTFDYRVTYDSYRLDVGSAHITLYDGVGGTVVNKTLPSQAADFPVTGSHTCTVTNPNDATGISPYGYATVDSGDPDNYAIFHIEIKNMRIEYNCRIKATADVEARDKRLNDLKAVYCGGNGLTQSFSGGSGVAQYPPDVFRDLLKRFAGLDLADSAITGITALDTARNTWALRWWLYKRQVDLAKVLAQLQYEGGFIWLQDGDSAARVAYVQSSYSSGDVAYALTGVDLRNVQVTLSPLSQTHTRRKYWYNRHPASEEHQDSVTKTASNTWNTGADEVQEIKLDFHATSTGANALATYYDQIDGEPKMIVSAELLRPEYHDIQVGDVVTFSDLPEDPFGESWVGMYFMVIKTQRQPGMVKITAREVYR